MILIFGGTTEGRMAVDVCEQAGKTFYYSTLTSGQNVPLHRGIRLVGEMTAEQIQHFSRDHAIRLVVDASHPFAEGLHQNIAASGLPVIRVQRNHLSGVGDVVWCSDYADAVQRLEEFSPRCLLALTGVHTIRRLKPFWQSHSTWFRVLPREESRSEALASGFPVDRLLYYSTDGTLPTVQQERELMIRTDCDAMVTKESGESGGLLEKVAAATSLGVKVFVVKAPDYMSYFNRPDDVVCVDGRHTLRRAIETRLPDFFPLRTGLTTGTCATAAAKAAMLLLLGEGTDEVCVSLPDGESARVAVEALSLGVEPGGRPYAEASVVKDFSDDPDVTRGCRISARVSLEEQKGVRFLPGEGVGIVTLPGLGVAVGEPAVNPVPRQTIAAELRNLTDSGVAVTISVQGGRQLAERTFNSRVGVVGGISIIGTSGIVSPLSNEAFVESIGRELVVARAIGCKEIGLASGKRGEEALIRQEPLLRVIHYGNFVGESLQKAHQLGFRRVVIGIMIGKAVKLAEGNLDTHSHKVVMNRDFVGRVAESAGVENARQVVDGINMARELWEVMPPAFFEEIRRLCHSHCRKVFPSGELVIRIFES